MDEDACSKFLNKLNALYSKKPNNTYIVTKYDYMNRLQRLTDLNDPQIQPTSADQKLLKNCCLVNDPATNQLKLCKPGTTLAYLPLEDLYAVLLEIHLQLNHAGRNCMQRYIRTRYCNVSKDCVMIFLSTCKNCPRVKRMNGITKRQPNCEEESDDEIDIVNASNSLNEVKKDSKNSAIANVLSATPLTFSAQKQIKKQETEKFSRGQVDLFEMSKHPDKNYAWFLRYTNCTTRQISLRPISTGSVVEIANALVDIYCDQGAPVVLQSLNGREFVQQVIVEVNKLYPPCRQLHSEIKDFGISEPGVILNQLYALMKRFDTNAWSGLLRILQFEVNTTYRSDINNTPFQMCFNRAPLMGLCNSKLIDILYERSSSIEDFMEYMADAELIRMSVFCQQTESNKQGLVVRHCEDFGFSSNTYSPISTNGIATTSTMSSQIVCTPESLPHSSTSSNNSFYSQPTPSTPTLPPGSTYHSLSNAQPPTPTQTQQQSNDHFSVASFDQSSSNNSPANYYPTVTAPQIVSVSSNEVTLVNTIKEDDSLMQSQLNDLQMNC